MAFTAVWFLQGALGSVYAQAAPTSCNRTCLEGFMSDYLNALAAHDPQRLPTTSEVLYGENDQILPLHAKTGEWAVAGASGKYRHVFSDPQAGQVAAITTIMENGAEIIYIVRLKVEDGKISEIETQITRDSAGAALYDKIGEPEAVWLEAVPSAERLSRATLITQSNKYYIGMERNDPKADYSFFDKDCNRLEDGLQTTNVKTGAAYGHSNDTVFSSLTCEAQFQTGFLGFVTKIRERRFVVDEERQAVFAITTLDHNGTVRELPDPFNANKTQPIPPYFDVPRTLQAAEAFRLRGDKLFRIEMTLTEVPYHMRPVFPGDLPDDYRGHANNKTVAIECDRACLDGVLDHVLKALLAHDASSLPLAQGVRYSENGQFLSLGDGLWETLGHIALPGVDDYAARFADPTTGTAGYWGLTKEQSTPGVLALRVKVSGGKITEIEAIDVRAEATGSRGGTTTLMRPPLPIEWQGDSLGLLDAQFQQNRTGAIPSTLIASYFDGLENHTVKAPFAAGCTRRDNGVKAATGCAAGGLFNLTTAVRDRRVLISDASKGIVLAVAMIDSPATGPAPLPASARVPSTYMVPQLVKVDDSGAISRVEGMIKWVPFGYTSAWGEEAAERVA